MKTSSIILILLFFTVLFSSCKKKDKPKQYSTWIVNGTDTFTTNNVDSQVACNPDKSYCGAVLMSHDYGDWYSLAFLLDYFPSDGKYQLYTPPVGESVLCALKIYYRNQFYYHTMSRIDTIYASVSNDKPCYTMFPCWFVNYEKPTEDSILIEGTFRLP